MDGVEGREFISTQGNSSHSVCASARYRHRTFVRHSSPFSTLFIGAKKTHSTLSLPSFDSFTAPHVNQCLGEGLVTQFSFLPSPLPHPASERSALSNTMQHPPMHRCFSHPHIARPVHDVISDKRTSLLFQ